MDDLIIPLRLVHCAALALLFGGSVFRHFIAPQHPQWRYPWPRGIYVVGVAAALLSAVGWFIGTAASMTGDWSEILKPDIVAAVLVDTRLGRLWTGRLALLVALLALTLVWRRQTTAREGVMLLFSGVLTAVSLGSDMGQLALAAWS